VLLIGSYTKRAPELVKLDKTYEVTMKLGETSTTGDEEGEKLKTSADQPQRNEIEDALQKFTGDIMQTPPAFSAIKVNGQRAYKLARTGQAVELAARPVSVYQNLLGSYDYPLVIFTSKVSSGTYIRSLVEGLGKELTTGAYMSDLRRTCIGGFDIKNALSVEHLDVEQLQNGLQSISSLVQERDL
jgi:tRNA pseudouridine55 synthase